MGEKNSCEYCPHEFDDEESVWQQVDEKTELQMCPECGIGTGRERKEGGVIVGPEA